MDGKFVSYLRVSTLKQGKSGLGLDAQREAVANYLNGGKWRLIGEFVEVESGKRSDRPKLAEALRMCRSHGATLVIAKLDRLARNVAFVANLMESRVRFVCCDNPTANDLTIHILSAVAQDEAKRISERTKAALAAAKARGTVLGGLRWDVTTVGRKGRKASLAARREKAAAYRADVLPTIQELQEQGITSLGGIAAALNARGTATPRSGGQWSAVQVMRILDAG